MTSRKLHLDAGASRLAVRTRATGMLARLAHDLEIAPSRFEASAEIEGDTFRAEVTILVADLEVAGVLKNDRLDASVLSTSDRADIKKRMQGDAFRGAREIRVSASGSGRDAAALVVTIDGRTARANAQLRTREEGDAIAVAGSAKLSLKALGSREIKAPLGAFSVKDEIEIVFDLALR